MMPSVAELLERESTTVDLEPANFERLIRRRDRKERNRRLSAAAFAIVVALVSFAALARAFSTTERPADEPMPKPPGIFSEVGGWIAYGDKHGIWAVDPTRPDGSRSQIQLSTDGGTPLAWSSDGSKLLIQRPERSPEHQYFPVRRLFVLNADGTETHLTTMYDIRNPGGGWDSPDIGGSFSPDGSQVIYASQSSIYAIDTQGGTPRVLQTASNRWFSINGRAIHALLYNPTFSPDGTQIAYFDGAGHSGEGIAHQLRVMNADGSGTRVLWDTRALEAVLEYGRIYNLAWSPDGEQLVFGLDNKGIYIVGADGSGFTLAIPHGAYPYWSPDGTRISFANLHRAIRPQPRCGDPECYASLASLDIADADGTNVQEFGYGHSGPWNPLVQQEQEVVEVPAASDGLTLTTTLLLLVALLALVAGAVLVRRRMVQRS